jgi:glycosyltransferase involved in cell wall biosynthesis
MSALKLVFVLPSLHGGGAERAAVKILNGLVPHGLDLTLYLFAREGAYVGEVSPRVRVVAPPGRRGRAGRISALRRFLAGERFDAVVSFLSHFTVFAAVRSSGVSSKYVISQQTPLSAFLEDADYHWRKPLHRRLFTAVARAVYPRADLVTATSRGVSDDLVRCYGVQPERVEVVHNPVDVEDVAQKAAEPLDHALAPDGRPTILTAGRLADAKNLPLLVESLKLLSSRVEFRAWVLGQGELEGSLRHHLEAVGLTDRVQLLGFQDNPWKFMAAANVFVLTSRYEGFGNVLIEAMASGAPVVATASFGTREILRHGDTGLLVERHQPDAVASALEHVLTDRTLRDRLVVNGRRASHEFGIDVVAGHFNATFRRLCA